jgi:hypothetical protein
MRTLTSFDEDFRGQERNELLINNNNFVNSQGASGRDSTEVWSRHEFMFVRERLRPFMSVLNASAINWRATSPVCKGGIITTSGRSGPCLIL